MNKHVYQGLRRYIFRHMMRATVKSILVILAAFAIFLTLGWLQETISRNDAEIDRLHEITYVFGQVIPRDGATAADREEGNVIRRQTIDRVVESELVIDIYFETSSPWTFVTAKDIDLPLLTEMLDAMVGQSNVFQAWQHRDLLDEVIAIEYLDLFIARHTSEAVTQVPGVELIVNDIEIEFATGFDQSSFVYTDESLATPVPVIISEIMMMQNGFELGDIVSIGYDLNRRVASWQQMPAVVIGVHRNTGMTQSVLMPLAAWEFAIGDMIGFTILEFTVNPMLNRELATVREELESIAARGDAGFTPLALDLHDEELRFVVQAMEENVSLLWLLYPVVVIVSMLIAIALTFFLILQNAKNVAVMRIFGATRKRASMVLLIEQVILCLSGLILGLCFLLTLDWGFGVLALFGIAGLYLLSVVVGSGVGVFIITRQVPLELLQVKE